MQKILLAFAVVYCSISFVSANPGERLIYFQGAIKAEIPKKVSVIELEKEFNVFSTKIYNPWDKKTARYSGIWLHELQKKFGKEGTQEVLIRAIDQYQITYPKALWESKRILLVTRENGDYIHLSNKGPMRIVFPDYDPNKQAYSDNLPMWMWMIRSIEFR